MRAARARDFAVALSLANLLLLKGWLEMLEGVRHPYFRREMARYWTDFAALAIVVFLLAALFWLAVQVAGRLGPRALRLARGVFLATSVYLLFLIANILRRQFPELAPRQLAERFGEIPLLVTLALTIFVAAVAVYRFRPPVTRAVAGLLVVLFPAVLLTFGKTAWLGWTQEAGEFRAIEMEAPEARNARPARRVVWMVFDNLDYRLAIEERPASLALPNLDRLLSESFSATQAVAPSPVTARSMTTLISGREVVRTLPIAADELLVQFVGEEEAVPWSAQPNIFSQIGAAGYRSSIIGWYHPYCRLFQDYVSRCAWWPFEVTHTDRPLAQAMGEFIRMSAPPWARVDIFTWLGVNVKADARRSHTDKYLGTLDAALRDMSDPSLGLVLVHWPVPHDPYIYDRATGELTLDPDPREGYLDNLALMDKALGQTLSALRRSRTLDRTAIIVTSDHSWRGSDSFDGRRDPRVPFIVRLPGTPQSYSHQVPFNTVATAEMIWEILGGSLATNDDLVRWLESRAGIAAD